MATPHVCPADHIHGRTVTCYSTHGCRCQPCRDRQAKNERIRYHQRKTGTHQKPRTAARTAAYIMYLEREGMTRKAIAERSGVSDFTLRRIVNGVGKKILPSTERAILAVQPYEAPRAGGRVDGTGTRRRLGALMALGYTTVELSAMLGASRAKASKAARSERVTITTRTAVKDLYDRLSMTVPELTVSRAKSRSHALKLGHLPPLEWDDEAIDDPNYIPEAPTVEDEFTLTRRDEYLIDAAIEGKRPALSPPERREVITVLNERRWSSRKIAKHIGCSTRTIDRIRKELGLPIYLANNTHHRNGTLAA